MLEIWKDIKGFEGLYQISSLGRVKSLERKVKSRVKAGRTVREIIMKGKSSRNRYLWVYLCKYGTRRPKRIHRIVAETFIDKVKRKPYVNHIDGDKSNNRVDNLEWCSRRENTNHARKIGLIKNPYGDSAWWSKLSSEKVSLIREIYLKTRKSMQTIANEFGVSKGAIQGIIEGKIWKSVSKGIKIYKDPKYAMYDPNVWSDSEVIKYLKENHVPNK